MEASCLPVVINESLEGSDLVKHFKGLGYKVKISASTPTNSLIFPKSSLAVAVYPVKDLAKNGSEDMDLSLAKPNASLLGKDTLGNVERFASMNRNSYLVLMAPRFDRLELAVFSALQNHFSASNLNILFCHSAKECVQVVTPIADATTKESRASTKKNIEQHIREKSEDVGYAYRALMCAGVRSEDVLSVKEGCESLAKVITSRKEYFLENTNLDSDTAQRLEKFFEKDAELQ